MMVRTTIGAVIVGLLVISGAAFAQDSSPLRPSPNALPAIQAPPAVLAQDATCASACQAQHDQCRVQTKGSPACDAERQRCLQACLASKKR